MLDSSMFKTINVRGQQAPISIPASLETIATIQDARKTIVLICLGASIIGGFHPDNDFNDYTFDATTPQDDSAPGQIRMFSKSNADYLNAIMDRCMEVYSLEAIDIYEDTMSLLIPFGFPDVISLDALEEQQEKIDEQIRNEAYRQVSNEMPSDHPDFCDRLVAKFNELKDQQASE